MNIELHLIATDAGTQIRAAINEVVVADYAEQMREGVEFPPVVLFHDGSQHYMADGFHRYLASHRVGYKQISADVKAGTKTDALWFALGANKANAHRMTQADKKHAIVLALHTWPDKSATEMALQIGVHQTYVSRLRDEVKTSLDLPDRVTGKDGKSYPASRKAEQKAHPKRTAVEEMVKAGKSSKDIVATLRVDTVFVALVRREMGVRPTVDKTPKAVQERCEQMRQMAADGHSSKQIAAAVGLSLEGCRNIIKKKGIDVLGDKATRNSRRHDPNRIVENIVMDAENLTADRHLIQFAALDRHRISGWIDSLVASRKALEAFIKSLIKEQRKHGEAA